MAKKEGELLEKEEKVQVLQEELAMYRASPSGSSGGSSPPRTTARSGSVGSKSCCKTITESKVMAGSNQEQD